MIVRAIFDWVAYKDASTLKQRKLSESAFRWLYHPNETFNSFENVCYHLDINPNRVRDWARKLTRDQVAKIEHLERFPSTVKTLRK